MNLTLLDRAVVGRESSLVLSAMRFYAISVGAGAFYWRTIPDNRIKPLRVRLLSATVKERARANLVLLLYIDFIPLMLVLQ